MFSPSLSPRLLYLIFFLSGASGLVYEVVWVRLTGLVFGNTAHAIATVLAAFMAGLALGSWKLGRLADRVSSPLRTYGMLEIGIGISAALVPAGFRVLHSVYWALTPLVASVPGGSAGMRLLTSFTILLIPTFLMGGTLPMLARFLTERVEDVERKVAVLYGWNTFGAAAGTLFAALYFIPSLGNRLTTFIIAAVNVSIGLFVIWLDRGRTSGDPKLSADRGLDTSISIEPTPVALRLVLLTLFVSGFVSMNYELAWTRALAALMGSSTYAFSVMLVTFLTGIALGSAYVSRKPPTASIRLLGLVQLGVAAGGFLFLIGYVAAPYVLLALIRALFYSFPAVLTIQFVVCVLLMIVATLFMGATFPIAGQLNSRHITVLGRNIGNVYSVNTVGAIVGSLVSGFILLPGIGTERTVLAGLFCSSALALLLLSEPTSSKQPRFAKECALALLIVATISMRGGFFWQPDLLDRGVLIYAHQFESRPELTTSEHYEDTDVVYFKEGNNATISVRKGENYVGLRTNGKVDASNRDDMMTQLSVSYLAGFFHPDPQTAMVIGFGSGVSVGAMAAIPGIREVDCIEIEPAVVQAAPEFDFVNRKSYSDPKVHIIYDDARNYMNVTRKQYDVIVSEPSNPWIAGVANLFTAEFYGRAAEVLKPEGIFAQWVQLYELDPSDLRMIFREFQRKFPEVSVWNTGIGDLILIGTRQPQHFDMGRVRKIVASDSTIQHDFREYLKLTGPEGILAYFVLSSDEVRTFAANAAANTDDHPLLEFHAPRQLFEDTRDLNVDLLYSRKGGLIPPGTDIDDPETTYRAMIEPLLAIKRSNLANQAMALLAQTDRRDPATLHVAIARIDLDSGNLSAAEEALRKASESQKTEGPVYAETEELWGSFYERFGAQTDAIAHYEHAVTADDSRALSFKKLAELNATKQDWNQAARWMERYVAFKPREIGQSWALLGDYRLAANHPESAMAALETALRLDPYTYWARWRLARLFEERKQFENAVEQYEFTLKYAFDRDPDVYLRLAKLYQTMGRAADAERVIAKGRRIFATNAEIYRLYQDIR